MSFTRKNVWGLGSDWADPILWYARGVAAMKAKPLATTTSWRFYGAIHGIDTALWQRFGYYSPSEPQPSAGDIDRYLDQCQHGTWYFLPWHRGYLLAFEANIRAEVVRLGGPADWALPYWNYFKPGQSALPPAFAKPDWPGGHGNNPLFVPQRWGPRHDGNVVVPTNMVNLDALNEHDFTGVPRGSTGFGGLDTGFEHGDHGFSHGQLEQQPHDQVHSLVGGGDPHNPRIPGLMSDPDTAALDPIFWLHHSNIDRLWQVWRQNPPSHMNPTDPPWLKGPASIGDRKFSMPMPGGTPWDYIPSDMVDLSTLGYTYDDLPVAPPVLLSERLHRLGAPVGREGVLEGVATTMASPKNVELVGANQESLPIRGSDIRTSVQLDSGVRRKVSASLSAVGLEGVGPAAEPDRVFLNLENVRGLVDSTTFQVYIGESLAGSLAMFGVRKASLTEGVSAGQGLTFTLEITKIVDALHLSNSLDVDSLNVRIVPTQPVPDEAQISIGRVSIFRQGS